MFLIIKFKKKLLHTKNIFYKKDSGYLICKILDKRIEKLILKWKNISY